MSLGLEEYPEYINRIYSSMEEVLKRVDGANISIKKYESFKGLLERILLEKEYKNIKNEVEKAEKENLLSVAVVFNNSFIQGFYIKEPEVEDKILSLTLEGLPNEQAYKLFENLLSIIGLRIINRPSPLNEFGEVRYYDSKLEGIISKEKLKEEYRRNITGPILIGGYIY